MADLVHRSYSDFDQLADEARVWSFELAKLDRSVFAGDVFQWIREDLVLCRGRFQGRLKQGGHPPLGMRTVAVPAVRGMAMLWRGHQVTGDQVCVFPLGGELDAVSDSRFDMFTISFHEDALLARSERIGVLGLADRLRSAEVFDCDPERLAELRLGLDRTVSDLHTGATDRESLMPGLLDDLIGLVAGPDRSRHRTRRSDRRLRVVNKAVRRLAGQSGAAISVGDLSRAVGVSVRTLQYAFREHLGMGPKAYINALRLNAARRELRATPRESTCVADVANHQGFWHMGQFAADYRRLFGENPSATLTRPA